jgi:ribonucleotide monophosphatase NagD (HAD superfamily)
MTPGKTASLGRHPTNVLAIPTHTNISSLIECYDALFFDSFGVLVDGVDALPGTIELVRQMNHDGVNYFVVTNDASVSLAGRVAKLKTQGFDIPVERIVNSGSLITGYFDENSLRGKPTLVLGTQDSKDYATDAGARLVVPNDPENEPDVVILGDNRHFDWEPMLEMLLGLLTRRFAQHHPVRLILPNPDFIFPNGPGAFGFGAAAFIDLLEQALERLHGSHADLIASKLG